MWIFGAGFSTLKMAMIHAIMGEDTKVLTKDEEIQSYFLEQYRKEMSKSEEVSWDVKYQKSLQLSLNLSSQPIRLPSLIYSAV